MSECIYDRTNDKYMEFIAYVEFMIRQHNYDDVMRYLNTFIPSPLIMLLKDRVMRSKKIYESSSSSSVLEGEGR